MNKLLILVWIIPAILLAGIPAAEPPADSHAYHLRVVRVSGDAADAGAAMGWNRDDGEPVVLPAYEAWGSQEQLEGLAAALGVESAHPITGYFLTGGDGNEVNFERKVYLGEQVIDLSFRAAPPASPSGGHELSLRLENAGDPGVPLAEASLRVRTDRTVAIASPLPSGEDWLVLAVTLLDHEEHLPALKASVGDILMSGADGVTEPSIISRVEPRYPVASRKDRLSGDVILQVVLDERGIPRAPMVLRMSPGCEELAASAVDAVLQWRYEPATLQGDPVPVYMTVNVSYRLE